MISVLLFQTLNGVLNVKKKLNKCIHISGTIIKCMIILKSSELFYN